jgi:hypothetical protein
MAAMSAANPQAPKTIPIMILSTIVFSSMSFVWVLPLRSLAVHCQNATMLFNAGAMHFRAQPYHCFSLPLLLISSHCQDDAFHRYA